MIKALKWIFGLNLTNESKDTLKELGLVDLDIKRIEDAGFYIVKRNLVITSIIALGAGVLFGFWTN